MTKTLDDFLPKILPNIPAPGAPDPLVETCLNEAIIKFCEKTFLWRTTFQKDTDGTAAETVVVPDGSVLHEILRCSIGSKDSSGVICNLAPLKPISLNDLADETPDWRTRAVGCESASWYVCPDIGTLQAVPRASGTLFAEIVLKPSAGATSYPDWLYDQYANTISEGAAAYVLTKPFEFANPQLASALFTNFSMELDRLFAQGRRGQQRAPTHTRARYF